MVCTSTLIEGVNTKAKNVIVYDNKIAKKKFRVYEVPISYSGRDYSEGKKITWKDGVSALWFIFKFRFLA